MWKVIKFGCQVWRLTAPTLSWRTSAKKLKTTHKEIKIKRLKEGNIEWNVACGLWLQDHRPLVCWAISLHYSLTVQSPGSCAIASSCLVPDTALQTLVCSGIFWVQRYLSNIVHFPFRKLFIPQVYGLIQELCISSSKDWLTWNLSNPVVKILPPKCGGYRFDS